MRTVHDGVRGVDVRGSNYTANDPALLAYVHATLVDSALGAADIYGPALTPADRDRYVDEMARVAELLGLPDPPRDAQAASGIITGNTTVGESRPGRDLAWLLMLPPLPIWFRPAYGVLFASAVDLLPRACTLDLALLPVWTPARPAVRAATTTLLASSRFAVGWRPTRRVLGRVARTHFAAP